MALLISFSIHLSFELFMGYQFSGCKLLHSTFHGLPIFWVQASALSFTSYATHTQHFSMCLPIHTAFRINEQRESVLL